MEAGVSPFRERLIRLLSRKWVNGTTLHFFLMNPPDARHAQMVRDGFEIWDSICGIDFVETSNVHEAEVRVAFIQGDGAWSYVGRDVIDVPGALEPTMNFGWSLTRDPDDGLTTVLHEIGHTLGLLHEHQNPVGGLVFNAEQVVADLSGPPNFWDFETIDWNVFRKMNPEQIDGSVFDENSVMLYPMPGSWILEPEMLRRGLDPEPGLSAGDIETIGQMYPRLEAEQDFLVLEPMNLVPLKLAAGEQADLMVMVDEPGRYTVATIGRVDTVMVLQDLGTGRTLAADDDSGYDYNASVSVFLEPGEYPLRVRLYSRYASGNCGVVMF